MSATDSDIDVSDDLIVQFHQRMCELGFSPKTVQAYTSDMRDVLKFRIEDSETLWLFRYVNQLRERVSAATLQRRVSAIKRYSRVMFSNSNVLENYRLPPIGDRPPHPLPNGLADVRAMIEQVSITGADLGRQYERRAIIALGGLCGLRIAECVEVKIEDFDIVRKSLRVVGKGGKVRNVPTPPEVIESIQYAYMRALSNKRSKLTEMTESSARQMITRIGAAAGIERPVQSHDLRMTYASHIYAETKNIVLVQYLLGHSNITTTQKYIGETFASMERQVRAAIASGKLQDQIIDNLGGDGLAAFPIDLRDEEN